MKPVTEITEQQLKAEAAEGDLTTPPFVVFVAGGPGCGKGTQCAKLREEFNLIHLSTGDLMRTEVANSSFLGSEIEKHMANGSLVPDEIVLKLLKKAMLKHQDTNRFLLDGFPRSVDQAKQFERDIAEAAGGLEMLMVSFLLYLEASHDTMKQRIQGRAASNPGRVDDNDETVKKRLEVFDNQTIPLVNYYGPIGKLRRANAETLGLTMSDLLGIGWSYANSNEPDAPAVRKSLAAGKPELERRTEMGLAMHNMLAKGQVVPLSMTLELLKGVANLTCIRVSPTFFGPLRYVDQIEIIENEFRIDKVYYVQGSEQAETIWAEEYAKKVESATASKKFSDLKERLPPIVAHFARLGKLEKFEVAEAPSKDFRGPGWVAFLRALQGLSPVLSAQQAQQLATSYGAPGVVTVESLMKATGATETDASKEVAMSPGSQRPLLLEKCSPGVWIGVSPDGDLERIDLNLTEHITLDRKALFPRAQSAYVYAFDELSRAELEAYKRRAKVMVNLFNDASIEEVDAYEWLIADVSREDFGEKVPDNTVDDGVILRDSALVEIEGEEVYAVRVNAAKKEEWMRSREESKGDARLLGHYTDGQGRRYLDFSEAIDMMTEAKYDDWPLTGPRACLEFLKSVRSGASDLVAYHLQWAQNSGISSYAAALFEHRTICDCLKAFIQTDQVDPSSLLGTEYMVRRLIQIETAVGRNPAAPDYSGLEVIMESGIGSSGEARAVKFQEWIGARLKDRAQVQKQARLYKEEFNRRRSDNEQPGGPSPKSKGKGKGKPKSKARGSENTATGADS
eukprot:Skav214355  [mRNA]  locus=scaffold86:483215:498428:+ [translate_table: standard]